MTSRFAAAADSAALLEILALQGVKTVCGGVTVPNEKSGGAPPGHGIPAAGDLPQHRLPVRLAARCGLV